MPTPRGINDVIQPGVIFNALIAVVGFLLIYMLNQKTEQIDKLNDKLDTIIEQNGNLQGNILLINNKLEKIEAQNGDQERRIRELEIDKARRDGHR